MNTATIQVAFVDPPEQGKRKKGRIKTTTNEVYSIEPIDLGKFRPGGFYDIEIEQYTWKGATYHSIKKATPHPQAAPQVVPGATSAPEVAPRTIPISDGAEYVEIHSVTAMLCAKIQTCQIGRDEDLAPHIKALREQYRRGFIDA